MKSIRITGTRGRRVLPFSINGARFEFVLRWSSRASAWYVSLWTDAGECIGGDQRLNPGWPLWRRHRPDGAPSGRFMPFDSSPESGSVGRHDINDRVQILHIETADIPETADARGALTVSSVAVV